MGGDNVQQPPQKTECRRHANVAAAAHIPQAARPAQLVIEESAHVVGGNMGFHNDVGEDDVQTEIGDAASEFIIVRQKINDGMKTADALQVFPPESEGRSQAETYASFNLLRNQNPCAEIGADAERFQLRAEGWSRHPAIQAGHHAGLLVGQRSDDPAQVVALHADVAVVDDQMIVASKLQHLLEIAHLHVCPENVGTDLQTDRTVRKFLPQLFDTGDGRIRRITDSENNFVFGIILQAVTAEALVDLRIDAFQRLENRNRRQ